MKQEKNGNLIKRLSKKGILGRGHNTRLGNLQERKDMTEKNKTA